MKIRIIIYLAILLFFIKDYRDDKKSFKKYAFPIILISFYGSTEHLTKLDHRIQLTIYIITLLVTIRYFLAYYNDYKIERFRHKKEMRKLRDLERIERDNKLLKEILDAKNSVLRSRSSSYEINMYIPSDYYQLEGQISLFKDKTGPVLVNEAVQNDSEIEEAKKEDILENQIEMF